MAVRRARGARSARRRSDSQNFLRSAQLARELVEQAGITAGETVVEIGAGDGRLTVELARVAGRVSAIEIDPVWAHKLRDRLGERPNVVVREADAFAAPMPTERFRVFANLPFHRTADAFRYLFDDPAAPLTRADLIVQWGVAEKRARTWPSTRRGAYWSAWYEFSIVRRLPASCFVPRPDVDAALFSAVRRSAPLVSEHQAAAYRLFLAAAFSRARVRESLAALVPPRQLKRLGDVYGFSPHSAPRDLDAHQWAAVFKEGQSPVSRGGSPPQAGTVPSSRRE